MKSFDIKTKVYFGDNALDRLSEIPYKKVLVITDPFLAQSSMINLITDPLKKGHIEYDIFQDVVPDPPIEKISGGVKNYWRINRKQLSQWVGGLPLILPNQSGNLQCGSSTTAM